MVADVFINCEGIMFPSLSVIIALRLSSLPIVFETSNSIGAFLSHES